MSFIPGNGGKNWLHPLERKYTRRATQLYGDSCWGKNKTMGKTTYFFHRRREDVTHHKATRKGVFSWYSRLQHMHRDHYKTIVQKAAKIWFIFTVKQVWLPYLKLSVVADVIFVFVLWALTPRTYRDYVHARCNGFTGSMQTNGITNDVLTGKLSKTIMAIVEIGVLFVVPQSESDAKNDQFWQE